MPQIVESTLCQPYVFQAAAKLRTDCTRGDSRSALTEPESRARKASVTTSRLEDDPTSNLPDVVVRFVEQERRNEECSLLTALRGRQSHLMKAARRVIADLRNLRQFESGQLVNANVGVQGPTDLKARAIVQRR
jgi:hypothetical protein